MSENLLYHGWGMRGYRVRECATVITGTTVVALEPLPNTFRCPRCGSKDVIRKGMNVRLFLGTPVGSRQMYFEVPIPRVECKPCGITRQVRISFADERSRHTRGFERYALELARLTTTRNAAEHLGVCWDTIRTIEARYLGKHFARPKLQHLRRIAIDEIYLGKKMKYLTVVMDLDSGAIVFAGRGKGANALDPFWKRLRRTTARIEAVAADMSPAYAKAVREKLPDALLVNDRFHVIKLYNEMLTELRRELYREAATQWEKDILKGTRWLLLKRHENLDHARREPERLHRALRLNESLAIAYYLRDDLNQFWEQRDKAAANRFMDAWIMDALDSGIRLLIKFAKTLAAHRSGLLAWYEAPISTGPLEAVNNKIRLLQRQAYGYRNPDFFQLKVYALHTLGYALVG